MGHIILIKTSFFLCKTHFLIKLSRATLGCHQDKQPAGSPLSMSNEMSSSRFPLLLKQLIKSLCRCRKLSDLVGCKCIEERRKWEVLGCSHQSFSRPEGATASSGVSALGQSCPDVASILVSASTSLAQSQQSPGLLSYLSHGISSMHGLHKAVF